MMYYSTNGRAPRATLEKAVIKGLPEDRGLYMPERIPRLPDSFFASIQDMDFHEIACVVADSLFGEDIGKDELHAIVRDSLSFDCPVVRVSEAIWALELFHGPTLAFKDVGARFMARLLRHFSEGEDLNVLVATSGDTGSAVANGFLGVEGIHVFVLYPQGKVSPIQECQFTTLGRNVTALEIEGVFDDCQALVKSAFMDEGLNSAMRLTSANSINVARFLPQSFYYFWAYAQMKRAGLADRLVVSTPSGNFGNLCAGLIAKRMGLPVARFIAANNANDVFYDYLRSGIYAPRPSIPTLANAMDVGDPSNFARILALYGHDWEAVKADISGATFPDEQIAGTIREVYRRSGYLCDPHGACGYQAVSDGLRPGETGVFCETAHPAKFKDTIAEILGMTPEIPGRLKAFMDGKKESIVLPNDFSTFKRFLSEHHFSKC